MKQLLVTLSVVVALCSFAATPALAQMKVGIVDMNKVFTSYYKTKDAEARLNDARAQAKTDLDGRLESLKGDMEEINKLEADAKSPNSRQTSSRLLSVPVTRKSTRSATSTAKLASSARPVSASCRSNSCACVATSCRTS